MYNRTLFILKKRQIFQNIVIFFQFELILIHEPNAFQLTLFHMRQIAFLNLEHPRSNCSRRTSWGQRT